MFIRKKPLYDGKVAVQSRYVQKRISMQYENLSIDQIRSSLIDVQYSVLKHKETQCRYRLPSKMPIEARRIYGIFNVKRGSYTKRKN